MQVTSKGSDQAAHMCRLVYAFAGRTYHLDGILMPLHIYSVAPSADS